VSSKTAVLTGPISAGSWVRDARDSRDGSSLEIPAERHLAFDVYYHPFAYRNFGTVVNDDSRFAGSSAGDAFIARRFGSASR
jgi:hypothetical protein